MSEPNYLDNHLYVLRSDVKQLRRHAFQMVDDLVFVTRHGVLRNLGALAQSVRAKAYLWTSLGPSQEPLRRIALLACLSVGVVAGMAIARQVSTAPTRHPNPDC